MPRWHQGKGRASRAALIRRAVNGWGAAIEQQGPGSSHHLQTVIVVVWTTMHADSTVEPCTHAGYEGCQSALHALLAGCRHVWDAHACGRQAAGHHAGLAGQGRPWGGGLGEGLQGRRRSLSFRGRVETHSALQQK
eukprot:363643-Chlamydomonas_euryale.AAC.7